MVPPPTHRAPVFSALDEGKRQFALFFYAEMMKTRGGRMITPVGTMGRYAMRGSAAYSASKWGR